MNHLKKLEEKGFHTDEVRDFNLVFFVDAKQQQLYRMTENQRTTKTVNLRFCFLSSRNLIVMTRYLAQNQWITTLDLYGNIITVDAAQAIADVLRTNNTIRTVELGTDELRDDGVIPIANALSNNQSVESIDLSENRIGDRGAIALARMLLTNRTITQLKLHINEIGDEGAIKLGAALCVNDVIRNMSFSHNRIGDEGIKAIADGLIINSSLTELYLTQNRFTDEGTKAIATMLKYNTTIKYLNFAMVSSIKDEGAKALFLALCENRTVISLYMAYCTGITDASAPEFIKLLKRNSSIDRIDITDVRFSLDVKNQIAATLHWQTCPNYILRSPVALDRIAKNRPWREEKHYTHQAQFRTQIFDLLSAYEATIGSDEAGIATGRGTDDEEDDDELPFLPWHDIRHVIQAWTKHRAQKALEENPHLY